VTLILLVCVVNIDVQFYSASFLGDMSEVVSHVTGRYPNVNLYAVGWSLGANILVRYLGQVALLLIPALICFENINALCCFRFWCRILFCCFGRCN